MNYAEQKAEYQDVILVIRQELDYMAIRRGELIAEYNHLLHEIGKIEYEEHALANHKPQK